MLDHRSRAIRGRNRSVPVHYSGTNGLDDALRTEIWAQLLLRSEDSLRIRDFFAKETGINVSCVSRRMHLTVYFAVARMPGVVPVSEKIRITVSTLDTRFMLMMAGGEVAKPGAEPANHKIGIRIQKRSVAMVAINEFRARLVQHESKEVLSSRASTTRNRSAFGAPRFQPHMTVLEPGNGAPLDLTPMGARFRGTLSDITFDEFVIDISQRGRRIQNWQADLLQKWTSRT
jgi:ABC-type uncharacterized transport system permease subunit